jgi:hypothetical protein
LFLNQLHAIECHEKLSDLLWNLVLLLKGMKIGLRSGHLSLVTIIRGNETAPKAWVSGASLRISKVS